MSSRFSLAAKLYSVFALFAVLVAAITALSGYNTRQNAELTEAVQMPPNYVEALPASADEARMTR